MGNEVSTLGEWLQTKCDEGGLSLRQVAAKVGVSHQTIAGLMNSKKALPQTIKKLAKAFGGDHHQMIALEDKLLVLAGYRTERPELSPSQAKLLDTIQGFDEAQLKMVEQFTTFLVSMERQRGKNDRK